ncbi:MAG: hypothetical protein VYA69_12690 [Gemmatimonadota bacterium]|nr:hypothetical protein [Gemmatimonadota bacterium]
MPLTEEILARFGVKSQADLEELLNVLEPSDLEEWDELQSFEQTTVDAPMPFIVL